MPRIRPPRALASAVTGAVAAALVFGPGPVVAAPTSGETTGGSAGAPVVVATAPLTEPSTTAIMRRGGGSAQAAEQSTALAAERTVDASPTVASSQAVTGVRRGADPAAAPLAQAARLDPPVALDDSAAAAIAPLHNGTIVLYGDSLAWEARGAFALAFADRPGVEVHERTFGGTAICDWLTAMADDAATMRPGAVVVEFSGNNFTPCMHGADGQPLTGDALIERYAADAAAVVATFARHGTTVVFGGAPVARDDDRSDSVITLLNEHYRHLAGVHDHVRYIDAGASVMADGSWTATLPCLSWEPCGADGVNVVRAPDGLHFCPASGDAVRGVTGDCPVWSSGAFRFGAALAAPVLDHLDAG